MCQCTVHRCRVMLGAFVALRKSKPRPNTDSLNLKKYSLFNVNLHQSNHPTWTTLCFFNLVSRCGMSDGLVSVQRKIFCDNLMRSCKAVWIAMPTINGRTSTIDIMYKYIKFGLYLDPWTRSTAKKLYPSSNVHIWMIEMIHSLQIAAQLWYLRYSPYPTWSDNIGSNIQCVPIRERETDDDQAGTKPELINSYHLKAESFTIEMTWY